MTEPQAEELLHHLSEGQPIATEDCGRLLSPTVFQTIAEAVERRHEWWTARGGRMTFWITGRPGNGKTQILQQIIHRIPAPFGTGKCVIATIDFYKERDASRIEGLVPSIVRKSLFAGVPVGNLNEALRTARHTQTADSAIIKALAFGIDVVATHTGLPPVYFLTASGIRMLRKLPLMQRLSIRRKLRKRFPSSPPLVEFLTAWANYVLQPTPKAHEEFSTHLNHLASANDFFDLFCYALASSGYSALVLICDEVTTEAVKSLKALWNPTLNGQGPYQNNLNLVFVLASPGEEREVVMEDEALKRRFCDVPCEHYELAGPVIKPNECHDDDFAHVLKKVDELLDAAPMRRKHPKPTSDEMVDLRRKLSAENDVNWHDLWIQVIKLMVRPK